MRSAAPRRAVLRLVRRLHRDLAHPLLSVLLPASCFACARPLPPEQHLGACSECWAGIVPLAPPLCVSCGAPLPGESDLLGPAQGRCAACVLDPLGLDGVRAAVRYDSRSRRFLLRGKFAGRKEVLAALGRQLAGVLVISGYSGACTVISPVPSHPLVLLRRGYNPAGEIGLPVAKALGLPVTRLLKRRLGHLGVSKRLPAGGRRRAAAQAFRALPGARGQRVLLVDDVLTTGATIRACAEALRRAGALEVRAAVWARTPLRDALSGARRSFPGR